MRHLWLHTKRSLMTKKNKILANLAKTCKNWQEFKAYWLSLLHSLTKKNKILLFFFAFSPLIRIFAS